MRNQAKNITVTILLVLSFTLVAVYSNGQINDHKIRLQVLKKGVVDSLFIFGKWTESGQEETHLKYLGKMITRSGQTFKIVNSSWFWGHAHRATSRILIFNEKNQYIGNYYLTVVDDLPTSLENGNLIFHNTDAGCDKKVVTIINLKNGLPKSFFRKCKIKLGDIYTFDSE